MSLLPETTPEPPAEAPSRLTVLVSATKAKVCSLASSFKAEVTEPANVVVVAQESDELAKMTSTLAMLQRSAAALLVFTAFTLCHLKGLLAFIVAVYIVHNAAAGTSRAMRRAKCFSILSTVVFAVSLITFIVHTSVGFAHRHDVLDPTFDAEAQCVAAPHFDTEPTCGHGEQFVNVFMSEMRRKRFEAVIAFDRPVLKRPEPYFKPPATEHSSRLPAPMAATTTTAASAAAGDIGEAFAMGAEVDFNVDEAEAFATEAMEAVKNTAAAAIANFDFDGVTEQSQGKPAWMPPHGSVPQPGALDLGHLERPAIFDMMLPETAANKDEDDEEDEEQEHEEREHHENDENGEHEHEEHEHHEHEEHEEHEHEDHEHEEQEHEEHEHHEHHHEDEDDDDGHHSHHPLGFMMEHSAGHSMEQHSHPTMGYAAAARARPTGGAMASYASAPSRPARPEYMVDPPEYMVDPVPGPAVDVPASDVEIPVACRSGKELGRAVFESLFNAAAAAIPHCKHASTWERKCELVGHAMRTFAWTLFGFHLLILLGVAVSSFFVQHFCWRLVRLTRTMHATEVVQSVKAEA